MLLLQSRFCGPQESQVEKNKQCLGEEDEKFKEGCEEKGTKNGKGDICF